MDIKIIKCDYNYALKANELLTKLIRDEKNYDKNINDNIVVSVLYEKFYDEENVCLLGALHNDIMIGYIYGFIDEDDDSIINKICTLDALYIEEEYRRLGVAAKLINELKTWAKQKGASSIELKVLLNNENAKNLYKKHNFKNKKVILSCDL